MPYYLTLLRTLRQRRDIVYGPSIQSLYRWNMFFIAYHWYRAFRLHATTTRHARPNVINTELGWLVSGI